MYFSPSGGELKLMWGGGARPPMYIMPLNEANDICIQNVTFMSILVSSNKLQADFDSLQIFCQDGTFNPCWII